MLYCQVISFEKKTPANTLTKLTSQIFSEEAENERMHLMTALQLRQPSWLFRSGVIVSQGR